jgi:hypothetical protein
MEIKYYFCGEKRVVSSVGLEHYLDRVGVTGSTPVQPTKHTGPDVANKIGKSGC